MPPRGVQRANAMRELRAYRVSRLDTRRRVEDQLAEMIKRNDEAEQVAQRRYDIQIDQVAKFHDSTSQAALEQNRKRELHQSEIFASLLKGLGLK
jgi:hypothetical protein